MKKLFFLILFAGGISFFAQKQTDHFTVSKISTKLLEKQKIPFDAELLNQPFRYLGKGGQSYVFLSEDGTKIFKCFRDSKRQMATLFGKIFPHSYFERKKQKEMEQLINTMESYFLAYEHLEEETALLGIHLHQGNSIDIPLIIIDKLGISHTLKPDSIPFVIQKKAMPVKEKIASLMEKNDAEGALRAFASLFSLIKKRIDLGLWDQDPNLGKNFGFIGETAVQIDAGRFAKCGEAGLQRIRNSEEDLQHWINAHYPQLSQDFHQLFKEKFHEIL